MKTIDRLLADWHTRNGASRPAASIVELTEQQQKDVLVDFLYKVAPDQVQFITGNYFSHGKKLCFRFYGRKRDCWCHQILQAVYW